MMMSNISWNHVANKSLISDGGCICPNGLGYMTNMPDMPLIYGKKKNLKYNIYIQHQGFVDPTKLVQVLICVQTVWKVNQHSVMK